MENPILGDQLRGHLDTMILSVLASGGETHGFDIVKRLAAAGEGALQLKEGTIYPVLYRLEAAGLVKAHWETSASGRRGARRKFYQLTKKGQRQLEASREQWKTFVSVVGAIVGGAV